MAKAIKKTVTAKKIKTPKAKAKPKLKLTTKKSVKKVSKKPVKKVLKKQAVKPTQLKEEGLRLHKSIQNPIIEPRLYSWESRATFNPTAFLYNGKIHLLYRAIGDDGVSVLGHASSFDGYHIQDRSRHFIYRRQPTLQNLSEPHFASSGGGWAGGCEDARATLIGDTLYVLYNAFDGWSSVRIALISISLEDFRKGRWDKWTKPIMISPPGQIQKAWVMFPEKINGKFAILYDIWPSISIQYFDDPDDFKDGKIIVPQAWDRWWSDRLPKSWIHIHPDKDGGRWVDPEKFQQNIWKELENDLWVRNAGPSPIKTKDGWLVIFHAIEAKDPGKYKLFAMLLDLNDPTKVLYRSIHPILEPKEHYESEGWRGIVYSCGAVVKSGRLFVYYGGGDRVVCVASILLKELIEDLKKQKNVKMKLQINTKKKSK